MWAFSLVGASRDYALVAACALFIVVPSLVGEHRLQGVWSSDGLPQGQLSEEQGWPVEESVGDT